MFSTHLSPALAATAQAALRPQGGLTPQRRRLLVTGLALAHGAVLWALLHTDRVQRVAVEVAPLMVRLLAAPAPNQPPTRPQQARPVPPARVAPPPVVAPAPDAAPVLPAQAITAPSATAAPAPTAGAAASPPAAPAAQPLAAPAPPPAPRKVISAKAVRYLLEPPVEVPRLSRRAGEHGVVWLRVVVGVQGVPLQVELFRSSGYPRLDEQALWAMRQARFTPHTEDGRPIEVEVIAPIDYPAP